MNQRKHSKGELYTAYEQWKGWSDDSNSGDFSDYYFSNEMMRAAILPGARLLEIGFGNGEFLTWSAAKGYLVSGLEINKEIVDKAKLNGHQVYLGSLNDVREVIDVHFDAVVAFDVFEHLRKEEIIESLITINEIMVAGGRILLRFPNGQSPFGRLHQYGDLTHETVLTSGSIEQAGHMAGFTLVGCYNPIRKQTGRKPWIVRKIAYLIRDLLEVFIGHIYYRVRIPLDPNLVCVLEKTSDPLERQQS
jgi:hypothetical protein